MEYMVNIIDPKFRALVLPAALGLIATVIISQVRAPAVELLPPYSTTIYSSTPIGNGHFSSSGATVYYAQAAPTPTPDPTGGGIPLKS
jgi:hypothetical protein